MWRDLREVAPGRRKPWDMLVRILFALLAQQCLGAFHNEDLVCFFVLGGGSEPLESPSGECLLFLAPWDHT